MRLLRCARNDYSATYSHGDKSVYTFVAIGNDKGRMFYLFDPNGNLNPLPKRNIWILLEDNLELREALILSEDKWIWENYQPHLVDASEVDSLEIKGKSTNVKKNLSLEKSFQLAGESLVEDDFRKESPLFCGTTVKVTSPYVFDEGWRVWISEKHGDYKLVSDNWTGEKPLELTCPEDLPRNYGEFQIDICQRGTRIAHDTLFFRWMPTLKLDYPRQLTLPNRDSGHESAKFSLCIDDYNRWTVVSQENYVVDFLDDVYRFTLPADKDCARVHISQREQSDIGLVVQVSIPRLRWRISLEGIWSCTPIKISPKELEAGKQLDLVVTTNDFFGKFVLEGILKAQEKQVQLGNFKRKGIEYVLSLNQFFDTIKSQSGTVILETKIWTVDRQQLLGMVEPIVFETKDTRSDFGKIVKTKVKKVEAIEKPKAQALCGSNSTKRRQAKGFSENELNAVGLTLTDVRRRAIPFDKRRKTCHNWNLEALRIFKNVN